MNTFEYARKVGYEIRGSLLIAKSGFFKGAAIKDFKAVAKPYGKLP